MIQIEVNRYVIRQLEKAIDNIIMKGKTFSKN